jgi:hypothetical protein
MHTQDIFSRIAIIRSFQIEEDQMALSNNTCFIPPKSTKPLRVSPEYEFSMIGVGVLHQLDVLHIAGSGRESV